MKTSEHCSMFYYILMNEEVLPDDNCVSVGVVSESVEGGVGDECTKAWLRIKHMKTSAPTGTREV